MNIYTVADWMTGFFEAYYLYMLFEAVLERREWISKWVYIAVMIGVAVSINLSNEILSIGMFNLIIMLLIGVLASFLYEGKISLHFIAPILGITITAITEVIVLFVLALIFNEQTNIIIADGYMRIAGIIVSKLVGLAVIKYITYRVNKAYTHINTNYWVLFFLMFLSLMFTIYAFFSVINEGVSEPVRNLIIVASCCLAAITVAIMYIYERNIKQQDQLADQRLLQAQFTNQIKHYNALIMSQEQVMKTRHDLRNHLNGIKALVSDGKCEAAVEYIDSLLEPMSNEKKGFDTGNTVLDALLSVKKEEAESKNIKFQSKILIPENIPIDDSDICIIFGNALDNAIEACEKVAEDPYISIKIIYGGNTLVCRIENSFNNVLPDGKATTKDDIHVHGIGKKSIESALEHYNSMYDTEILKDKYIFSFFFWNIYDEDKNRSSSNTSE